MQVPVIRSKNEGIPQTPGGWFEVLRFCASPQFEAAFQFNDQVIIQIDTDVSGEHHFDVPSRDDDGREFTRLLFDPAKGSVSVDKSHSTLSADNEGPPVLHGAYSSDAFGAMRQLRVIVDGSAIEVFVNDAAAYAVRSYPSLSSSTQVRMSGTGNQPISADVKLWPLRRPTG